MTDVYEPLGEYAGAGRRALELALDRAAQSTAQGRIPIAAAAVLRRDDGELATIAIGHNGRIPPPGIDAGIDADAARGYPTDHGETAAVRQIEDVQAVDWRRVVFATTLSPCIMCYRTLAYLHDLGLDKIVIAESESYPGSIAQLLQLPGMTVIDLADRRGIAAMEAFARTYPWDWAADIGAIPPGDKEILSTLIADVRLRRQLLSATLQARGRPTARLDSSAAAMVIYQDSNAGALTTAGFAIDRRTSHSGNPTHSAPMIALGRAGSAVNLRDSVLVFATDKSTRIGIAEFGHSSLGACELFRPAAVLSDAPFTADLSTLLGDAGIEVIEAD